MYPARTYASRRADQTILHRCVRRFWPRVRDGCEAQGRPLPSFVRREFEAYLRCGDLKEGFARIHCFSCGLDRLVPFSCKGRGFCPSCGGRRMHEGATWLCERVLPPVPLRQFVLSLSKVLRYLLAYDGKLCRAVAKTAIQEIFRFQRLRARKALGLSSTRQALTGAMVAVQRFGSALNLNIHFHALVLDGVYVLDAFGHPSFEQLKPPSRPANQLRSHSGSTRPVLVPSPFRACRKTCPCSGQVLLAPATFLGSPIVKRFKAFDIPIRRWSPMPPGRTTT